MEGINFNINSVNVIINTLLSQQIQWKPINQETDKRDIRLIGMKFWKRIRI